MTHEDFVALLDKANPRFTSLSGFLRACPDHFCFARKGRDLVEVVEEFRANGRDPVVDKTFRLVIGCFAHRAIRAELYRYHKVLVGVKDYPFSHEEDSLHADAYTHEGLGYHFSSMSGWAPLFGAKVRPIVGEKYRPDRLDKDLFRFYDSDDAV